jgi:drug/metabolite transporter (DMT)-like permease
MKTKTFIIAGLVGGIANWLLGWLFYGILLADFFPQPEEASETMVYILLGCLMYGLFISYVYNRWAQISTAATGAKAGAVIGLFMGLYYNFFNLAMQPETTAQMAVADVGISIVMTAIVGAIIGAINGKMN